MPAAAASDQVLMLPMKFVLCRKILIEITDLANGALVSIFQAKGGKFQCNSRPRGLKCEFPIGIGGYHRLPFRVWQTQVQFWGRGGAIPNVCNGSPTMQPPIGRMLK